MQWPRQLNASLEEVDPQLYDIIEKEKNRQFKVRHHAAFSTPSPGRSIELDFCCGDLLACRGHPAEPKQSLAFTSMSVKKTSSASFRMAESVKWTEYGAQFKSIYANGSHSHQGGCSCHVSFCACAHGPGAAACRDWSLFLLRTWFPPL